MILLSGGSGKRLWPLSNDVRSKQFLKIFPREDGSSISMVQRVYRQIRRAVPSARVTIATSQGQVSVLREQLGDGVDICVEPCRRDTFPAIALASAYLHDVKGVGRNETVAICPVDPYVEEPYFRSVKRLAELAEQGMARLMLMGIEPSYPSEKYGYILPSDSGEVSYVTSFKEKPDEETAAGYIAAGALWNSGVFSCSLGYLLDQALDLVGMCTYQELENRYESLERISFDYAVVEKEKDICVLRYPGEWKDLGTWNTLTEVMKENVGDVTMDDGCSNTHVINELGIPLLCMGLKDMVVVAGPDGILVSDKQSSGRLKEYAVAISETRKKGT